MYLAGLAQKSVSPPAAGVRSRRQCVEGAEDGCRHLPTVSVVSPHHRDHRHPGAVHRLASPEGQRPFPIASKASSYVDKLGKRFFAHRYFVENLAARFAMISQAGGFAMLGLLASPAHRKRASGLRHCRGWSTPAMFSPAALR